jgi:carboxymethylenebutenolidase
MAAAPAAPAATAPAHSSLKVSIKSENKAGEVPGYLFVSEAGKSSGVGIVVIQEWWGINDEIKLKGSKFSAAGFSAIVPDLYRGKVAKDDEEAGHLMGGLDWQGAVQDIKAAGEYLKAAGYKKIFVTGYCMGGALTLASAVLNGPSTFAAGIVYYGICDPKLADPKNLKVPLQCHFGKLDTYPNFSDPKAAGALETTLTAIKASFEFYHYDGANHAFTKSDGPNYNAAAAATAFERTVAFVNKHAK